MCGCAHWFLQHAKPSAACNTNRAIGFGCVRVSLPWSRSSLVRLLSLPGCQAHEKQSLAVVAIHFVVFVAVAEEAFCFCVATSPPHQLVGALYGLAAQRVIMPSGSGFEPIESLAGRLLALKSAVMRGARGDAAMWRLFLGGGGCGSTIAEIVQSSGRCRQESRSQHKPRGFTSCGRQVP